MDFFEVEYIDDVSDEEIFPHRFKTAHYSLFQQIARDDEFISTCLMQNERDILFDGFVPLMKCKDGKLSFNHQRYNNSEREHFNNIRNRWVEYKKHDDE